MPRGVPCPLVGLDKSGAVNGALFALRVLAVHDPKAMAFLEGYQKELEEAVRRDDAQEGHL
jgi:phosphoribosylcarboxyaminoimidazole (NCAIR) mutase